MIGRFQIKHRQRGLDPNDMVIYDSTEDKDIIALPDNGRYDDELESVCDLLNTLYTQYKSCVEQAAEKHGNI